jgi:AraC-like DNA-binding protein
LDIKKISIAALGLLPALIFVFIHFSFQRPELQLFPFSEEQSFTTYSYNDRADGGESEVQHFRSDSIIDFAFILQPGFSYPYCGAGIDLSKRRPGEPRQYLDLSLYDSLLIELRSTSSEMVRLQFLTWDPQVTQEGRPESYRFLEHYLATSPDWSLKNVSLKDFAIPSWWIERNQIKPEGVQRDFTKTWHFEFLNSNKLKVGVPDTLQIRSIRLVAKDQSWLWHILASVVFWLALLFSMPFFELFKLKIREQSMREVKKEHAITSYEKLPVENQKRKDTELVLKFVAENFSKPDLSLEMVTQQSGINRNKLTALLKAEIGLGFKTYLNEIRLKEAARHIAESDLQITEIAYKVGYNNISHFNRLFKQRFACSPGEYRKNSGRSDEARS